MQLSLPRSVFPFSFLLSHLVTGPLERSVEFPLSQRRGQSEPHKEPQWTPSALPSLHSVTAQLHTHTQKHRENYIRVYNLGLLIALSCLPPHSLSFAFLCVTLPFVFSATKSFPVVSSFTLGVLTDTSSRMQSSSISCHFLFTMRPLRKLEFLCYTADLITFKLITVIYQKHWMIRLLL